LTDEEPVSVTSADAGRLIASVSAVKRMMLRMVFESP
jgi:hypothetical protein